MVSFSSFSSKFFITLILWGFLTHSADLPADQRILTDDGREVLMKNDGTWEFLSDDRFADTGDGRRVRLRADGTWEYTADAPRVASRKVRASGLDIELQRAVIETHEVRAQKNKRVSSQTVFYFSLTLSPQTATGISIDEADVSLVRITDNRGRHYPVLAIRSDDRTLDPGSSTALVIRADGSPQWWKNVKSMRIVFSPEIFGIKAPLTLIQQVDDLEKKKVDGFSASCCEGGAAVLPKFI